MTEAKELAAVEALIAGAQQEEHAAMQTVLGPIPAWVPAPIIGMVWRQAARLWALGIDPQEIRSQADALNNSDLISNPASVPLHIVHAINDIANFRYAVSLGKRDGLRELAGPAAELGERFREGRKPGTVGAVRALVAKLLKKQPGATTAQLWEAISKNPPRGWQVRDNRLGKYVEAPPGKDDMSYRRFANVCSEERRKAKGKITG